MTKKIKHSLEYLIEKSARKESSEAEEQLLNDFMLSEYQQSEWDTELMGSKKKGILLYSAIQKRMYPQRSKKRYFQYAAAAGIALLIGLGLFFNRAAETQFLTFRTAAVSDSLQLGDGSKIYLAANSVFEYPAQFEGAERNVKLVKGNAFFHVSKDPQHPFIIQSGTIRTRVVGTSFHIQLSKNACTVIVATGKVNVSSATQSVDLKPGDEALFSVNKLRKQKATKTMLINWYSEDAELNSVALSEVFTLLEYKYGIHFSNANTAILDTRLTLFIGKTATLDTILKQINYITNLKFEIYEDTVKVN